MHIFQSAVTCAMLLFIALCDIDSMYDADAGDVIMAMIMFILCVGSGVCNFNGNTMI